MYGRREQVEAHSFLIGRLAAAVVRADPDAPERPLRRTTVGVFGGIAIGALVVAVILIISLLTGGSGDSWRAPGTLVVAEDSGNRYLMVGDRLHPVLNYASARLLVGGAPTVATVSDGELAEVPKGSPIGILGAPDALPAPGGAQPWTVCAGVAKDDPAVAVLVGDVPGLVAAPESDALLVRVDGTLYLAWQGSRLRVTGDWAPLALGLNPASALPVDSAWLNTLPAGPDLGVPPVQRGGPGPVVGGVPTTVGQLVSAPDAVGNTLFVAAPDGLIPVTDTVATLLTANPELAPLPTVRVTPAELATQQVLAAPVWQAALPANPPFQLDTEDRMPCVRWAGDEALLASAPAPSGPGQGGDAAGVTRDGRVADWVDVTPGGGFLARTRPAPGVPGAGVYLVTESGAKFPVASGDAAEALGFSVEQAELVPAELLALLPTGPVLDVMK